ncbi:MAG: InlB B-repeat-containing protein [Candidatus Bathyarchaeota archaeon]|nr:InlB B-repeat-containing protein [Candidatus Termiticorpusculum sp.]
MKQLLGKISLLAKKRRISHYMIHYMSVLLIIMLMGTTVFIVHGDISVNVEPTEAEVYDVIYYVSANGNDNANDGLSEEYPFATLAKTADIINGKGMDGNYLIFVMTDLTSTYCARYYDNSVTITSLDETPCTVTRGSGFEGLSDNARSWYNPAMLEIGSTNLTEDAPKITLTLKNIIFDDAYLHEGTIFRYAPTPYNPADPGLDHVQDAIVASYAISASIILDQGAELHNFGGMTAIRAADHATVILKDGSLITDIRPNAETNNRAVSPSQTNWAANGEAAISIANSYFYMYSGAKITNIANVHAIKFTGTVACFMDGEIAHMIGNKGMDTDPDNGGRGVKGAIYFDQSPTIDHINPMAHISGSAIIGPNAYIHDNAIKCGAICVSRNTNISVKIYGKINNNVGGTGSTLNIAATNGGGLYIVNGGTVYLEDGCEIIGNRLTGAGGYGGAASVQQSGSRLIMNGGTISGNSGSATNSGITVNKGDASFEMNGGIIENGDQAVHLYESGSDGTAGKLTLNAGIVSGVTVDRSIPFGYSLNRHLFINQDNVIIETGYVSVAGRNVYPISADFKIGNPNTAIYTSIRSNLPKGWSMPTTDSNVVGFWIEKDGTAKYSVLKPTTGTGGTSYNAALNLYFAAVQATTATGTIDTRIPLKLYPTTIEKIGSTDHIVVSVPIDAYPNGAVVVLVQPTTLYGEINFQGPTTIVYDINAQQYTIPYTASYTMPTGLHTELIVDGHSNTNTAFNFIICPDSRTIPDISNLTFDSDLFEIYGSPVWNALTGEFVVTLLLKDDWDNTINMESTFKFNCIMAAANFEEADFLSLTGHLGIVGNGKTYFIYGNEAKTLMVVPKGTLCVNKILTGDAVDATRDFHFTITFSNDGTYDDVASGSTIALKGGKSKLIEGIPQGVTYAIVELEANQDGYTTTSTGARGVISEMPSEAVFVNSKNYDLFEYVVTVSGSFAGASSGAGSYYEDEIVTIRAGSRDGYVFAGWTINSGGIVLGNAMNAITTFVMPANDVSVTATWKPVDPVVTSFVVVYSGNGASSGGVPEDNNIYKAGDAVMVAANPGDLVKTGYVFLGWAYSNVSTVANFVVTGSSVTPDRFTIASNVTLYAVWSLVEVGPYRLIYDANWPNGAAGSGTVPVDNRTYVFGASVTVLANPNSLAKSGYVFLGWAYSNASTVANFVVTGNSVTPSSFTMGSSDVTLYAVWSNDTDVSNLYSITYSYVIPVPYGAPSLPASESNVAAGTVKFVANVPMLAGYAFEGWSANTVIIVYPNGSFVMPSQDVVFTGSWVAKSYTVHYDVNGADSGDVASMTGVLWNDSGLLSTIVPKRSGYAFEGWFFNGVNVTISHRYSDLAMDDNIMSITLQAQWSAVSSDVVAWAFVNLVLSVVGIVLAVIATVYVLLQRKSKAEHKDAEGSYVSEYSKKHSGKEDKPRRNVWLFIVLALSIVGVVVFLLTEDMSLQMKLIDKWSIVNAAIFLAGIIGIMFAFKHKKDSTDEKKPRFAFPDGSKTDLL